MHTNPHPSEAATQLQRSIGKRVEALRLSKGLSRPKLLRLIFEKTGQYLTISTIQNLETGKFFPKTKTLQLLAATFDTSVDALAGIQSANNRQEDGAYLFVEGQDSLIHVGGEQPAKTKAHALAENNPGKKVFVFSKPLAIFESRNRVEEVEV